jgi:hypothetical protein
MYGTTSAFTTTPKTIVIQSNQANGNHGSGDTNLVFHMFL